MAAEESEREVAKKVVAGAKRRASGQATADTSTDDENAGADNVNADEEADGGGESTYFPPGLAKRDDLSQFDFSLRLYDLPVTLHRGFDGIPTQINITTARQADELVRGLLDGFQPQGDDDNAVTEPDNIKKDELFQRCGEYLPPFMSAFSVSTHPSIGHLLAVRNDMTILWNSDELVERNFWNISFPIANGNLESIFVCEFMRGYGRRESEGSKRSTSYIVTVCRCI